MGEKFALSKKPGIAVSFNVRCEVEDNCRRAFFFVGVVDVCFVDVSLGGSVVDDVVWLFVAAGED